jgi:hypothetical protein
MPFSEQAVGVITAIWHRLAQQTDRAIVLGRSLVGQEWLSVGQPTANGISDASRPTTPTAAWRFFLSVRRSPESSPNRTALAWSLAFVVFAFILYGSGGQDDTYITFWPARALAEHGQILNYNGVRLEQSSSLSLVVVLAILYKILPFSMPTIGFLTSMAFGMLTVLLAERAARRLGIGSPAAVAPVIASVASFGCWATSGMETSLVTASGLFLILKLDALAAARTLLQRWVTPSLAVLFFGASRPESPFIVVGVAVAGIIVVMADPATPAQELGHRLRISGRLIAVAFLPIAVLLAFRRLYFHAWVPNPAFMKSGGFNTIEGLYYLWDAFVANGFTLLALALLGLSCLAFRLLHGRSETLLPSLIAAELVGHLGFAVASGGDWMNGARFLAPAIPSIVLLGMTAAASWLGSARSIWPLSLILTLSNLFASAQYVRAAANDGRPGFLLPRSVARFHRNVPGVDVAPIELANKIHERDAVTLSHFLPVVDRAIAASDRPIWVLTGQAGKMGYELMSRHFGKAKLIDLWSLTTRELYDCLPKEKARKSRWGTFIDLGQYLDNAETLERTCGLPRPDIYYNECWDDALRSMLERHGYRVLYNQTGDVQDLEQSKILPARIPACGSIAIRADLATALGISPEPDWVWDANP